jgi:hypothetical protein
VIVLGCDVGKTTGLALLDCGTPKPRYLDAVAVHHDLTRVLRDGVFCEHVVSVIGIETPSQVFEHGRAKLGKGIRIGIERNLLIATRATGIVEAVAALYAPDAQIQEGEAHEVRRAVLGKLPREGIDAYVRAMVPHLVDGWPVRSNDHERDAAIVALYAWQRRTPLPIIHRPQRRSATA